MKFRLSTSLSTTRSGRNLPPWALRVGLLLAAAFLIPVAAVSGPDAGDAADPPLSVRPLSLAEARELALSSDELLRQAAEAVAAADAGVLDARSGRLPRLSVGGTWTRNIKKPVFFLPPDLAAGFGGSGAVEMGGDWDLQAAATVTWNLWTAGRLSAASGAAGEALAASEWRSGVVHDAVIYTVDEAYHGVLLAVERVAIAEQARAAAEEALRVTDAAFEQGTASRFDRLRARVELANREAPVLQARNGLRMRTLRLLRLCGLDPDTRVVLADRMAPAPAPAGLEPLLRRMREQSPELQSMRHVVAARRQSVALARAARGPVVRLQGQYAVQGQWDGDILPGDDEAVSSASAALAVSLPIFDGFATKAGIRRSEAELRSAEIELERITRDRELSVRQARLTLENALAALEGRQDAVDLAAEAYRLVLVRRDNGLATALERLDAELALTEARVQLAESLYNSNLAEAGLKLAVGGGELPAGATEESER